MRKIRYLIGLFGAIILLVGGFSPLISRAAETVNPTLILSSNTQTLTVDETHNVTLQGHNLPAASVVTIDLPNGLTVDQDKLLQGLDASKVQATVTSTKLELKLVDQTEFSINVPVKATQAGEYQLQASLNATALTSNELSFTSSENESSTSNQTDDSTKETTGQETTLDQTLARSARSGGFRVTSDQTVAGGALTYVYYYNNNVGLTMTGTVIDPAAQTLYVGYSISEGAANVKALGTFNTSGGSKADKYSYTIPASAFPAFNDTNYGKVYNFRLVFQDKPIGQVGTSIPVNLRLVYAKGTLSMTAPSEINFGDQIDPDFTAKPTLMGTVASGDALSVIDTREFGTALPYKNGWAVTATLGQQMTGKTNKQTLTDSLHYLNNGTDYTLGSAAVPVYNLKNSAKGTTNISNTWNGTNGLAFEPAVGQPQAGESYQGVVQWNLQETPANS
ncbi:hypothetical protein [Paucilactobacillus kaifaensis]|uniref:hypothetical protein n=1 Tax=Paucilactobacillus kaifaensis TaxID=2559921 RepID=UPI0010FA31FC|nr:hypothetical protein [Paucilactobacillus kaifaensis]